MYKWAVRSEFLVCKLRYQVRYANSLTHYDGKSLWRSLAADTGKGGGRGKRKVRKEIVDLGKHKVLGEGKEGYLWPGLNTNTKYKITQRSAEEQEEFNKQMELKQLGKKRVTQLDGTQRGWTGGRWGGQLLVAKDDEEVQDFKAYIFNAQRVSHMRGSIGRVYSARAIVAVGNGRGTFGLSWHSSNQVVSAARTARLKALNRLQFVERFEDRTVFEDMYVNHHRTFMHIRQQPRGYGLRCHRAVSTLCKLVGIKDIYVKTYGSTTMLSVVKCFIKALLAQETHQQKADRIGYHIVQFDPLRDNYPVVLASPKNGTREEPYDEYNEYLKQPLITRTVRRSEGYHHHSFLNVLYSSNQGPPIPVQTEIPEIIKKIKDAEI